MKATVPTTPPPTQPNGWALALDRTPVFLAVLLLFSLPFMARADGAHPHLPQWILMRIVTFGLATAFALQCVRYRRLIFLRAPFWWPLMSLLLWVLASALFSPYPAVASGALLDGLLPFIWFAFLFLLFREVWRVENLLMSFLAGALVLSVMALAHRLGGWEGLWKGAVNLDFHGMRLGGLENTGDRSGYYLVAWPLALALLLKANHVFPKFWWGTTLAFVTTALMLTGTRSSSVGLLAGALVFAALNFRQGAGQGHPWRGSALGFLLLVVVLIPFTPAGKFLTRSFQPGDEGRLSLSQTWSGTWDMIRERPVSGVGLGVFATAFPSYRPSSLGLSRMDAGLPVAHPRNLLLEWTAETGWIGLILAVVFWVAVLMPWWKLMRGNAIPRPLGAAAFSAFAGVLISGFFNDSHSQITTLCPLFFVAAMPAALSQRFHTVEGSPVRVWVKDAGKFYWALCLFAGLVSALLVSQVLQAFKAQVADLALAKAVSDSRSKEWNQAVEGYQTVLQGDPGRMEALYGLASIYLERDQEGDASLALPLLEQVGKQSPDFAWIHRAKQDALKKLGRTEEAENEWGRAVQLDPGLMLQDPRFIEAKRLASTGRCEDALRLLDLLAREHPDQYWVWITRAQCCESLGRMDDARHDLAKALAVWPDSVDALLNLGYVANAQQDRSGLAFALKRLRDLDPNDPRVESLRATVGDPKKDDAR